MLPRFDSDSVLARDAAPSRPETARRIYVAPALEYLGRWNALTLQQSVQIAGFQRLPMNPDGEVNDEP